MNIETTGPVGSWILKQLGLAAVTMPWRIVYVLPEYRYHVGLMAHEHVHLDQMQHDGAWYFTLFYLYFLVACGYMGNPYELHAYDLEPITWY